MTGNVALKPISILSEETLSPAMIVGWNTEAVTLYDRILSAPAVGYDVKVFIKPSGEAVRSYYKNVPVLADLARIEDAVKKYNIQEVLIVLSPAEKHYLSQIISICTKLGVNYRLVSDAYDEDYGHVIRDIIREVWRPTDFSIRRIIDFSGALFLLIFLFPLFIVTAIAIKLESKGPIFYSQERYGRNGTIFKVYKFRSMVQDAEKKSGPVWASKNDPRITKVGQFMRKTRIDELPQLMNVLKGDMSFIGPRPERPFFAETFKRKIPFYMNRLKARPGITGLAQVTVGYDETLEDVKQKVARDIEYIDHMSSWKMNFKILFMTIGVMLRGEGQ